MHGTRLAAPPGLDSAADTPLRRALQACRKQFLLVGVFSGAVNLLQLTTSIYMMQVFDRVLTTRVLDTPLYLSLIAGAAVLVLALLEAARGQIMQRVATWVENRVAPEGFVRAIESTLRGRPYRMEALRDLAVCRGYLGSSGALSLYDVPWVPVGWRDWVAATAAPQRRAADRAAVLLGATKFFRLAVQISILGVGAYLVLMQELTSGASIAGSIIMGRALAPVEQMIGGWKQLVQARQSFRRLESFLAQPRIRPPGLPLPEPAGRVEVERVSYAFPGQGVAMIKGVNFALAPGESLAVIGPSAAGKTTLIRLLIGTLPASAGTVRLDGADVYQWMREDFGRHVGYLPQDVELFDGTVFANIARMGEAAPEEVFEAAKLAGCHEMILRLPDGYETQIGEGGMYLSGGQRQLIGLARAMFGRPKLVVLDEPNSNLDGDSEAALIRALERLKADGTTVILVSHRPTLVQGVDKVLLLKDGAMEMFGPRAEVLKRLMTQARPAEVPAAAPVARLEGSGAAR